MPPFFLLLSILAILLHSFSALPQFSSPLLPGSVLPPASSSSNTDPSFDNLFSAAPAAGLGTPLVQTSPFKASTGPNANGGAGSGALPNTLGPVMPSPPSPGALGPTTTTSPFPVNSTLTPHPANTASSLTNTTQLPRNSTLDNLAPGTIKTDSAQAVNSASAAPDSGLGGLVTAGIVVASVVLASMIGIFLFRKWKLRPKKNGRWRTRMDSSGEMANQPGWRPPSSSLPLHQAMMHSRVDSPPMNVGYVHGDVGYVHGDMVRATPPPHLGYEEANYGMPQGGGGAVMFQPPVHARTVEMDLALRHHLRQG